MSLDTSLDGRTGKITFNRPAVHNALSTEMWRDIPGAVEKLVGQGAQVLIFTGAGDSFAAGADLAELKEIRSRDDAALIWHSIENALEAIAAAPVPTIARINGPCLGGGCLLATACDLRLAAADASFAVPVARLSIKLNRACLERLSALIGPGQTKRLLFQAVTIGSGEAERIGLVEEVAAAGQLDRICGQYVERILANSAAAISYLKLNMLPPADRLNNDEIEDRERIIQQERDAIIGSYLTSEFKERLSKVI